MSTIVDFFKSKFKNDINDQITEYLSDRFNNVIHRNFQDTTNYDTWSFKIGDRNVECKKRSVENLSIFVSISGFLPDKLGNTERSEYFYIRSAKGLPNNIEVWLQNQIDLESSISKINSIMPVEDLEFIFLEIQDLDIIDNIEIDAVDDIGCAAYRVLFKIHYSDPSDIKELGDLGEFFVLVNKAARRIKSMWDVDIKWEHDDLEMQISLNQT